MRVTGGFFRNSIIKSPKGLNVRPTSERVREALFNILALKTEGAVLLDLFSGSGVVGIEALSRGAEKCIFIEKNYHCVNIIRDNLERLNIKEKTMLIKGDVIVSLAGKLPLAKESVDLIFCDPPYRDKNIEAVMDIINKKAFLKRGGILIVEHSRKNKIEANDYWLIKDIRRYGDTVLTFLQETGKEKNI